MLVGDVPFLRPFFQAEINFGISVLVESQVVVDFWVSL